MRLVSMRTILYSIFVVFICSGVLAHAEDYDQFKLDLILAKRGDPGAQFYVASAYEEGRGVKKDLKQAFAWFSKGAANKHNGAQFKLGEFYENGWGVKKDQPKAEFWYKKAEKNGSRLAGKQLAQIGADKQLAIKAKSSKEAAAKKKEQDRKRQQERKRRLAKEKERSRLAAEKARREKKQRQLQTSVKVAAVPVKHGNTKTGKSRKITAAEKAAVIGKHTKAIFSRKWYDKEGAASVLPSSVNNCLESSNSEIVCFSKEQRKIIDHSEVSYTSKSMIKDVKYNGSFTLAYYFNVLDISVAGEAGAGSDPLGLKVQEGWQEPQQKMQCSIHKGKIQCSRDGNKFYYHP